MGLLRTGNVRSVVGVRRPGVPVAQAQECRRLGRLGENRRRYSKMLLPLAVGNPQDLGGWRPASGPGEIISDARELLVIDGNLLDDAGFHACARAGISVQVAY